MTRHRFEKCLGDHMESCWWRDVRIVLDRREGERREPHDTCVGVERRRAERRHRLEPSLKKLGWAVVDTNELVANRMNLLADLEDFVTNHHPHGTMTSDATPPAWNGYLLAVACPCGVVFERWVTPEDAELDLRKIVSLTSGS